MDSHNDSPYSPKQNPAALCSPVAYVRPVSKDENTGYAVCTSDGVQLAVFASRDAAFFAAKQHDLAPTLVH